jgi:ABC-2 type transport system permease protein
VAKKESRHVIRDLRSLLIVLLMPIVMLLLYGFALNSDIRDIRLTVADRDGTSTSRDLVEKFTASKYFILTRPVSADEAGALQALKKGATTLVMVIPDGFASDLKRGRRTAVQVLADGTDPSTAAAALGYAATLIAGYSGKVIVDRMNRSGYSGREAPGIRAEPRLWFNQEMRSAFFLVPGLIAIIMMLTAALLTSLTIVREKDNGTFEQLIATPITPVELMVGKLLPYIAIGFADVIIITILGGLIFSVPFRGSVLLLGLFSLLFIFCALGIGLLVSSIAPNQTIAVIGTVFLTVLPSVLLSGFVFPVDSMPWFIKPFTFIIPARYFFPVLRALFLKTGAGLDVLWPDGLALLVFGLFLLLAASKRLKKTLE